MIPLWIFLNENLKSAITDKPMRIWYMYLLIINKQNGFPDNI